MSGTRDTAFVMAFHEFMSEFSKELRKIILETEIPVQFTMDPASYWKLARRSDISARRSEQLYDFTIPREVVLGYEDRRPAPENGGEWDTPATAIMANQYVPTPTCFSNALKHHFQRFYCIGENGAADAEPISYVKLDSIVAPTAFGEDLVGVIKVLYFRDYRPFPRRLTAMEIANSEIEYLSNENYHQEKKIRRLKKEGAKYQTIAKKMHDIMQSIVRGIHKSNKHTPECPVCYVDIDSNAMYVPGCMHFICTPCAQRCNDTCPICREEYFGLDTTFNSTISEPLQQLLQLHLDEGAILENPIVAVSLPLPALVE
jgi:Zinc finger, C3HC4 type (RING finger)